MLVLTRKPGETIRIGDNIKITVSRASREEVRLAFDAPAEVVILREELWQKKQTEGDK